MSGAFEMAEMELWVDALARSGPECMAVDEWLYENARKPVLRVYRWRGNWASLGYFGLIDEAREAVSGVDFVRRWTGGGIVDHRADWTYTLVVPKGQPLASARAGASYEWLHGVLAEVLREEGHEVGLSGEAGAAGGLCFVNPVRHDLVDLQGRKLAGAGQRRGGRGLLHQGSVALPCDVEVSAQRAMAMACRLSGEVRQVECEETTLAPWVAEACAARYGRREWTDRR